MKKIIQIVFLLIGINALIACDSSNGVAVESSAAVEEQVRAVDFVHDQMGRTTDDAMPVEIENMNISFTEDQESFDFLFNE